MNEMDRFDAAFAAELEAYPDTPPGPTALNARMGKTRGATNVLNGRRSKRRRVLLAQAGFVIDDALGARWRRP